MSLAEPLINQTADDVSSPLMGEGNPIPDAEPPVERNKLGTFMGVVVPTLINVCAGWDTLTLTQIFGLVLFVRLGWVIGQAGIPQTFIMYLIIYILVTLTCISVSAMATNGRMKGGGVYYLISRSLGPEFAGSIGIIFWAANVASTAMYLLGWVEAFHRTLPMVPVGHWWDFLYTNAAMSVLATIAMVGANLFARSGFLIFILLVLSLILVVVSFAFQPADAVPGYTSWSMRTLTQNMSPGYTINSENGEHFTFPLVFSILFPSVTGTLAGTNMSGDLASPHQSIPSGTLFSIGLSFVVYFFLVLLLGSTTSKWLLQSDYLVMRTVAFFPYAVDVGIWVSLLFSAMANIVGGARVLQALARDNIFPFLTFFGKGSQKGDEPRRAVFVTCLLAVGLLVIGDLNAVAPLNTSAFVATYIIINISAGVMRVAGVANFRPTFKYFSWHTAFLGALSGIVILFMMNALTASICVAAMLIIFFYILYRGLSPGWGSVGQALMYHQVRKYLLRLDSRKEHVKFWRPQLLLLVSNPRTAKHLIGLANNLKKGGLFIAASVLPGPFESLASELEGEQLAWRDIVDKTRIKAFPEVLVAPDVRTGVQALMVIGGLGAMKPNIVCLGFHSPEQGQWEEAEIKAEEEAGRIDQIGSVAAGAAIRSGAVAEGSDVDVEAPFSEDTTRRPRSMRSVIDSTHGRRFRHRPRLPLPTYLHLWTDVTLLGKTLIVARNLAHLDLDAVTAYHKDPSTRPPDGPPRMTIDVWPRLYTNGAASEEATASLALSLGYILSTTDLWRRRARLRVMQVVERHEQCDEAERIIKELLEEARISADVVAVPIDVDDPNVSHRSMDAAAKCQSLNKLVLRQCATTALLFVGMSQPPIGTGEGEGDPLFDYWSELEVLTRDLPAVMMVHGTTHVVTGDL